MNTRPLVSVLVCCVALGTLGCGQAPTPAPAAGTSLEPALQQIIDDVVQRNESVRGAAMHVDSPLLGLAWEGAAGLADPAASQSMTPQHPVRIASNTKTFVAAAVLRLVEQGRLGLDDAVARHIGNEYVALLTSGGYDPERITVRHLLTHTSGLYDHADSGNFSERILAEPHHQWTRTEQLTASMEWGQPWGEPGEVYHYADTGYILLGAILERSTGASLAAAVRQLVGFDRLGLTSTWWEILEPKPAGVRDRAHQFLADTDSYDFDPYFDLYGGGGIVCTVGDLATFFRAVFTGGVYDDPATVDTMLTTLDGISAAADATERSLPPGAYRMGLWVVDVNGYDTYWHGGFWGTTATYTPELDLAISATVNQRHSRALMEEMVRQVVRLAADAAKDSDRP